MEKWLAKIKQSPVGLIIVACLIVGSILRLDHLGLRPLWLDEAGSANLLKNDFAYLLKPIIDTAANLAYIYFLKIWSLFFGSSEIALRSFSVLTSLLAIIAIYKLAALWFNKKTGYWAAWLLAVSYFSIFYAIQVRPYSLIILLSILSYYYFSKCLEKKSIGNLIVYTIITLLGVYTHPWFFLLLLAQILYQGWGTRFKRADISGAQLLVILIFLPWLVILYGYGSSGVSSFIGSVTPKIFGDTFYYFTFPITRFYIFILLVALVSALLKIESLTDRIYLRFKKINLSAINKNYFLVMTYFFIPLVIAFGISLWEPFYLAGRYEAIVLPALILFFATLGAKLNNKIIIIAVIFLVTVASWLAVKDDQTDILNYKYNDRVAAAILLSKIKDGDMVIYTDLSRPTFDYYLPRLNKNNLTFSALSYPAEMKDHPLYQDLEKLSANQGALEQEARDLIGRLRETKPGQIWVILNINNPASQIISKQLENNFKVIEKIDLRLLASPLHFQYIIGYK